MGRYKGLFVTGNGVRGAYTYDLLRGRDPTYPYFDYILLNLVIDYMNENEIVSHSFNF